MTTPTQPPDPRVERIAKALAANKLSLITSVALARVLVEELGGRERETVKRYDEPRTIWRQVMDALEVESNADAVQKALTLRAQQRENAETIKVLKERVATAEAANTELDNARKSAEQSARDLRENNATLRAELDAIKGAQVPYRWTVVVKDRMSFTFTSLGSAQTWANGEGGEVIPLYRHPAPTLPVVGACVVRKDGRVIEWSSTYEDADGAARNALHYVRSTGDGTAHQLLLGAPLPTEGGK